MKRNIFLILTLLLLSACSCEKRMAHLERHCPECFNKITFSDTVATPSIRIDTVFVAKNTVDTFFIDNPRVELMIIKQVDTFYTTLHLKPDTIIRAIEVSAPAEQHPKASAFDKQKLRPLALWLVPFAIVTIIYLTRKKLFY